MKIIGNRALFSCFAGALNVLVVRCDQHWKAQGGRLQCPILLGQLSDLKLYSPYSCSTHSQFLPHHDIPNRMCVDGTLKRHRFNCAYMANIMPQHAAVLHIAPNRAVSTFLRRMFPNADLVTAGKYMNRSLKARIEFGIDV